MSEGHWQMGSSAQLIVLISTQDRDDTRVIDIPHLIVHESSRALPLLATWLPSALDLDSTPNYT
jgi:hypothetical protein